MDGWPIKFVSGAKPGKKRKNPSAEGDSKAKYERNRGPREFKDSWKEGRDWLVYDEGKGLMCKFCVEVGACLPRQKNSQNFISGSTNYRFSAVSTHETSTSHIQALAILDARKGLAEKKTVAHKTIISLNESRRKQIELKFRNIHALVKHNRPISDFTWLNELDEVKGLQHGNTYNNRSAGTLFLEFIADNVKCELVSLFENVKFFSFTMDGSTDSSTTEQETIFVRFCIGGQIHLRFVCIGQPRSTSSADLLAFVKKKISENNLDQHMHKLVGFGSDGAANMMGIKSGLITLIRVEYPEVIGVHCLAHRLELAFKDVVKAEKIYIQLTTLLLGLYYFYKNSSKQKQNLKECMKVCTVHLMVWRCVTCKAILLYWAAHKKNHICLRLQVRTWFIKKCSALVIVGELCAR